MKRASRAALLATAIVCGGLLARAEETSPAELALARDEFQRGVEAAEQGRWDDARAAFARSFKLHPGPATLLNLAGAEARTRHLVAAAEDYRRVLREGGLTDAQRAATSEALAQIEARTPHVRIRVDPEGAPHTLALDDAPISPAAESAALPIDPGEHVVTVARAGSGEVTRERFSIQERELRSIQLSLPPPLAIAAPAQPEARSGGVLASPWFWTAVGVVVIGGTIASRRAAAPGTRRRRAARSGA